MSSPSLVEQGSHAISESSIEVLRSLTGEHCLPSPSSVDEVRDADIVLVGGQFVGAGKSTFITVLEEQGRINIPSWTNRDLRPGEVEGVDKCHRSLEDMARAAESGFFLELEENRPGVFYATPAEFTPGRSYVKDLELRGAVRLRGFAPDIPIIVPLPPLQQVEQLRVTEWERRVVAREGFDRAVSDKAIDDLKGRLEGVAQESERVLELGLLNDPNTLVLVNDDLEVSLDALYAFLRNGDKKKQIGLHDHIRRLQSVALTALNAYE